ncbi:MAG TPA: HAD-IA family hydrolase, partial [Amphiplicatus sp.]|nr:HAD-IA family hydrolase [Amphiplicatus sp.]
ETLGLAPLFSAIVGMDTTTAAKPDPAPVLHSLSLSGAKRGVFIGDSDTDIRAATAAGMPCLIGSFGYGPVTLADKATGVFGHYDELTALVRSALA